MIRITVLEDDPAQAETLFRFLHTYETDHTGVEFSIRSYDRGVQLLEEYDCDADVVMLDIQVPDMLGMEVARRVRQMDQRVLIVFVTSFSRYAIEGYSVHAFDYMLKPLSYAPFCAKLERIVRAVAHSGAGPSILLKTKQGQLRLSTADILYAEVVDHDVSIHTGRDGVIRQWGSLAKLEAQLDPGQFVRCNSCYLVNLQHVTEIRGDQAVVEGRELAISKPRRKAFLQAFAQYKGGSR